jgi:protein TonB
VAVRLDPGLTVGALDLGGLVFDGVDLDQPPRAVVRTEPPYPYRARRRNVNGTVTVKLLVRADGSVGEVEILAASPPGYFEDAVRQAVPRWRFEPGRLAGEAVPSWAVTTITFDLEG